MGGDQYDWDRPPRLSQANVRNVARHAWVIWWSSVKDRYESADRGGRPVHMHEVLWKNNRDAVVYWAAVEVLGEDKTEWLQESQLDTLREQATREAKRTLMAHLRVGDPLAIRFYADATGR